jgi:cation diffusion facilitator family transporter
LPTQKQSLKNLGQPEKKSNIKTRVIYLSVGAAIATILLKSTAYLLTGSVGLLSDAIESLVNLVGSLAALVALIIAARPADRSHSYGHTKTEYLSSGLEGALILIAAGAIGWTSIERLLQPPEQLESLGFGLGVSLVATLINFVVARILLKVGRREDSIALEADGKHLMTDVVTSIGVVVGLALVWLTNWLWLDPVVALAVALNIIFEGSKLVKRSLDGLMDQALPKEEEAKVRTIIEETIAKIGAGDKVKYHGLRSRKSGSTRFVDFHFLTPGNWTVEQSHKHVETIEKALISQFKEMKVLIHVEPMENPTAYGDNWDATSDKQEPKKP